MSLTKQNKSPLGDRKTHWETHTHGLGLFLCVKAFSGI